MSAYLHSIANPLFTYSFVFIGYSTILSLYRSVPWVGRKIWTEKFDLLNFTSSATFHR